MRIELRAGLAAAVLAAVATLSGCSTSYWYNHVQASQYDKCERLADSEERRRCKDSTRPNEDQYNREREAARSSNRP